MNTTLLLTVPCNFLYPQEIASNQIHYEQIENVSIPSYDEILQLLDQIESGELEEKCTLEELEKITQFIAFLAKQGVLPDDSSISLEEDIEALLGRKYSSCEETTFFATSGYKVIPAVLHGHGDIVLCKSWVEKQWKNLKKFAKDHKKELIIGAVVIVVVAVVVVAVVATSAGAAAAAGAAGAVGTAAGSSDSYDESDKKDQRENSISIPTGISPGMAATNEAPMLKAAMDEQISSFKEFVAEDTMMQASQVKEWSDCSFGEKARELGAHLAHQTFDELTDLVKVVPQLCEEIKGIRSHLLPESFTLSDSEAIGDPIENYENFVAQGHKAIDKVFSTDQSEFFSAEAKANDPINHFDIGVVPPPGELSKVFSSAAKLIENGKVLDRAGFTKAGRGLMKHGYRDGSVFPRPVGSPEQVNEHGQKILESIVNHPERQVTYKHTRKLGEVVDIHAPGIGGVRYNASGELIGFLEP